jgi:hypothetical protein
VIRRGFWLLVGAAAGIAGYRKAGQFARQPTRAARETARAARETAKLGRGTARLGRDAVRFARDGRDGMDEYTARHPRPARPTLSEHGHDTERHGNGVG